MTTLTELAKRLRDGVTFAPTAPGTRRAGTEAADRLEAIHRAWLELEAHIVGRADSRYIRDNDVSRATLERLRLAISGAQTKEG